MFIFPLIFICSFVMAVREILRGNTSGLLLFMIFGLSIYTTTMSVTFMVGLKSIIPTMQFFKEALIFGVLLLNLANLKYRPRFHLIDYTIMAFLLYLILYALLPIGEQGLFDRLIALKSTAFYIMVYFVGRTIDAKEIYVNKYFNYLVLLTIAAGAVLVVELLMYQQLQLRTGYAEYNYYFFNAEPSGQYGISTTFDSDSGYRRFASFFTNPLELAAASIISLAVIAGLYTTDNNKLRINTVGMLGLGASFLAILFALSRAPLASYFVVIYVYALLTKRKAITHIIHLGFCVVAIYVAYLFWQFEQNHEGIIQILVNTIDFSDPSSIGHLQQWVEGVLAIINNPMGLGLGSSGRVAGTLGENVGGENQYIIIGVQAGIIALLLYLCIYVMVIRTGIKWLPKLKGKERQVCLTVLLIKIGFIIPSLTSEFEGSAYISYINWFLTGLLINMIMKPMITQTKPADDH